MLEHVTDDEAWRVLGREGVEGALEDDVLERAVSVDERDAGARLGAEQSAHDRGERGDAAASADEHQQPRRRRRHGRERAGGTEHLELVAFADVVDDVPRHSPVAHALDGHRDGARRERVARRRVRALEGLAADGHVQREELARREGQGGAGRILEHQGHRVRRLADDAGHAHAAQGVRRERRGGLADGRGDPRDRLGRAPYEGGRDGGQVTAQSAERPEHDGRFTRRRESVK